MSTVKVEAGQVWKTKDKRRDSQVVITRVTDATVTVTDIDGSHERGFELAQLHKRWNLFSSVEIVEEIVEKANKKVKKADPKKVGTKLHEIIEEITREQWLTQAVEKLTPLFSELELEEVVEVPRVRVSVGWPGGHGPKTNTIGQCWKKETTGDGVSQIFISPVLSDATNVLATLLHEIVHATDNGASGHRGHFKRTAAALGFVPKFTIAVHDNQPNSDHILIEELDKIAAELGPYPHSAISPSSKPKAQKTYMLKLGPSEECVECDPDYKLRMTEKWLEEGGAPLCPHGIEMVEAE